MRKLRNTLAGVAPLTPIPKTTTLTPTVLKLAGINNANVERLEGEIKSLRILLAAERRRHAKLESAICKYQALLEKEITEQTARVQTLRVALMPTLKVSPRD